MEKMTEEINRLRVRATELEEAANCYRRGATKAQEFLQEAHKENEALRSQLAEKDAKLERLVEALREYYSESTNPAKDYTLLRIRREQLFEVFLFTTTNLESNSQQPVTRRRGNREVQKETGCD